MGWGGGGREDVMQGVVSGDDAGLGEEAVKGSTHATGASHDDARLWA